MLSVDEKSQIQALDRTQPGLPLKRGRGATMTHDYKRNGTTTLFAALNVLDGSVIGRNMQRHRHQEFIRFLNAVEAELPQDKAVHVILDNYATHKQPKVRAWLDRHPRWTFHFVPTSCSWLNAVEGFFAKLTRRRLKKLAVAPSSYHQHAARLADPGKRSAGARHDDELKEHIRRVHEDSFGLYGSRKVWRQLLRDGVTIAKCTVERLIKVMGLAGVWRGKSCVTTVPDRKALCPLDKVNREFKVQRPNAVSIRRAPPCGRTAPPLL